MVSKIHPSMSTAKTCPECGVVFTCGAPNTSCWCAKYPAVLPPDPTATCLCPDCLAKRIGHQIETRLSSLEFHDALELARQNPSNTPLIEHIDFTMENKLLVLSRWYLLKIGKCCEKNCRNCPYPH
jgi:hypothetical protein